MKVGSQLPGAGRSCGENHGVARLPGGTKEESQYLCLSKRDACEMSGSGRYIDGHTRVPLLPCNRSPRADPY